MLEVSDQMCQTKQQSLDLLEYFHEKLQAKTSFYEKYILMKSIRNEKSNNA